MQKILVPVDFSPAMEGVLVLAREMAQSFNAELHLVHVRELTALPVYPAATIGYPGIGMPEMGMGGGIPVTPAEMVAPLPNEHEKNQLDAVQAELTRAGLRAVAHLRDGSVVEEILQAAEEISADLIVMGSHGHGSVYNLLVGSVTEGVLKAGRRPLLLVPAPAAAK
ncbi:MAG TPA: universal stress protein [Chthoniobacterales bacterium]|nr:universal stress protein [Chthoniobacterales bacterium]